MHNRIRTLTAVVLIAAVFGVPAGNEAILYAAEAPEPDPSEEQTAEEMLAAEAALEAQETQAGGATAPPGSDPSDAPEAVADRPPGGDDEDFVPTLQISEDLSVSFPVDI